MYMKERWLLASNLKLMDWRKGLLLFFIWSFFFVLRTVKDYAQVWQKNKMPVAIIAGIVIWRQKINFPRRQGMGAPFSLVFYYTKNKFLFFFLHFISVTQDWKVFFNDAQQQYAQTGGLFSYRKDRKCLRESAGKMCGVCHNTKQQQQQQTGRGSAVNWCSFLLLLF